MRLTEKNKMAKYGYKYLCGTDNFGEGCNKLGQLEDILEKYNIDTNEELEILCKYAKDVRYWMSIYKEKMFEIRRIEDELGIDLITLFKALKYPIYVKEKDQTWWCSNRLYFALKQAFIVITDLDGKDIILPLKDYGKTWALTKEELEK